MKQRILITGGAGFIGSRLTRQLSVQHDVWVLDSLHPQVHGPDAVMPTFAPNVRAFVGDVRDEAMVAHVMRHAQPQVIYHLAAETGTGQSHDELVRYCEVNVTATARLIDAARHHAPGLHQIILAGSRAVYGEGLYNDAMGARVVPDARLGTALDGGDFEIRDVAGTALTPQATDEATTPSPSSVYASTKLMQEYLIVQAAARATWKGTILRMQNVYGPGQSLRNPYTGVLSIFCSQLRAGKKLDIYEDGDIVRDFVFVDDVVQAFVLALGTTVPHGTIVNIGSGRASTILGVAQQLMALLGVDKTSYAISGRWRPGDIRHAVADISRAQQLLGWTPGVSLEQGLERLVNWVVESSRNENKG